MMWNICSKSSRRHQTDVNDNALVSLSLTSKIFCTWYSVSVVVFEHVIVCCQLQFCWRSLSGWIVVQNIGFEHVLRFFYLVFSPLFWNWNKEMACNIQVFLKISLLLDYRLDARHNLNVGKAFDLGPVSRVINTRTTLLIFIWLL